MPSSAGVPSTVTVSTRLASSAPKAMTAVCPRVIALAADLAQCGGHPDLVLALEAELGGQLAAEPARGEHARQVPDLKAASSLVMA